MNATFPIQLAKEAILLSKFTEAIDLLRPLAEAADPEGQFLYANLHFLTPDLSKSDAFDLLRAAADRDNPEALYLLATHPSLDPADPFSPPTSSAEWKLLRRAIRLGSIDAKIMLARLYLERKGNNRYLKKAHRLLKKLAKRRTYKTAIRPAFYPEIPYLIGLSYANGLGVRRNISKACGYFDWAAYDDEGTPYALHAAEKLVEIADHHAAELEESRISRVNETYEKQKAISIKPDWYLYLRNYCLRTFTYDLTNATFDEFIAFTFEHFVEEENRWNYKVRVKFDPRKLYEYYLRLLNDPAFLLKRYNQDRLTEGFWTTRWESHPATLSCIAFHPQITVDETEALVRAAYPLFWKLFAHFPPYDQAAYMWWDSPYDILPFDKRGKRRDDADTRHRLAEASFEVMTQVLQLDSPTCQNAALHGMNHMHHPYWKAKKEIIIPQFLAAHPDLPEDVRKYAEYAIEGGMM